MKKILVIIIFITVLVFLHTISVDPVSATEGYADSTMQECETCHVVAGGELTKTGEAFAASGYKWPPPSDFKVILPLPKPIRVLVGFLHLLIAVIWFGTILYVHIILKPAYASKGLPKGEVFLGLASMLLITLSGVVLTLSRVSDFAVLHETLWGKLLLVKVSLFAMMVITAIFVVRVLGPRLKQGTQKSCAMPVNGIFEATVLANFDGQEGRKAFVACNGKVYDVTDSKRWRDGAHIARHYAGNDLTADLAKAPHGADKFDGFTVVGSFDLTAAAPKTVTEKRFYFIAYLNLAFVFIIIFVIAFMRWGV